MNVFFWLLLLFVMFALFGGTVLSAGWWLLWTLAIGLVIGACARLLVRNTAGFGTASTIVTGIAGSIIGGWVAYWLNTSSLVQYLLAVLIAAMFIAIGTASNRTGAGGT